jgi:hypothetical protein
VGVATGVVFWGVDGWGGVGLGLWAEKERRKVDEGFVGKDEVEWEWWRTGRLS